MRIHCWLATALIAAMVPIVGCQPAKKIAEEPAAHEPMHIEAQKAVAGVGKKGRSLEDNTGIAKVISGPASAYFKLEQTAVLEWQIPQAIQLFQASEGRFPKSHDEFMQKIVQANKLVLPELPEGAVYQFHSDTGELWVHPAQDEGGQE